MSLTLTCWLLPSSSDKEDRRGRVRGDLRGPRPADPHQRGAEGGVGPAAQAGAEDGGGGAEKAAGWVLIHLCFLPCIMLLSLRLNPKGSAFVENHPIRNQYRWNHQSYSSFLLMWRVATQIRHAHLAAWHGRHYKIISNRNYEIICCKPWGNLEFPQVFIWWIFILQ